MEESDATSSKTPTPRRRLCERVRFVASGALKRRSSSCKKETGFRA